MASDGYPSSTFSFTVPLVKQNFHKFLIVFSCIIAKITFGLLGLLYGKSINNGRVSELKFNIREIT